MYEVSFDQIVKAQELESFLQQHLFVADVERALAVASLLQKVATPEVQFGDIKVQPFKKENHETQKN